jgi:hypothetical protein
MLTITTPKTEKLYSEGVAIASIMGRVSFTGYASGKSMQVAVDWYESEAAFDNGDSIIQVQGVSGFPTRAVKFDLSNGDDPETWKAQTIQEAHNEMKTLIDGLGYLATISGI